jgi:predicted homoserine dehydrogenase-like protein
MRYLKLGDGPCYLFYRPFHLCHFETPWSIAEAVLDHEPTIAPLGHPIAEVVTVAKRDLNAGELLDGIGGHMCYGQIDAVARCIGLLPIGLAQGARLLRSVRRDQPVTLAAVELDESSLLLQLWRGQQRDTTSALRQSA